MTINSLKIGFIGFFIYGVVGGPLPAIVSMTFPRGTSPEEKSSSMRVAAKTDGPGSITVEITNKIQGMNFFIFIVGRFVGKCKRG